jgi:type I restriction enzyme M protein
MTSSDKTDSSNEITKMLWEAYDLLFFVVQPTEYKFYLLSLLFLKFVSDRKQEKTNDKNIQQKDSLITGPEQFDFDTLYKLRKHPKAGEFIDQALINIEQENYKLLPGVFSYRRFSFSSSLKPEVILKLLDFFAEIKFQNHQPGNTLSAGQIYDKIVNDSVVADGKRGGEYYTPQNIAQLMVEILNPLDGMSVYDPAMGTAGFLTQAYKWVQNQTEGKKSNLELVGQEVSFEAYFLARMNFIFNGIFSENLYLGNSLLEPKNVIDDKLQKFDLIISNPPFSLKLNSSIREQLNQDPYGRFWNIATRSADFIFIQHILSSLNNRGKAIIITSSRLLFVSGQEGEIRKKLIEDDLIEAVISLGPGLLPNTGIPINLLIINKAKPPERRNRILFVNAVDEYERIGKQGNIIGLENQQKIIQSIKNFKNIDRFASVATIEEIRTKNFNLNSARYIKLVDVENFLGGKVNWKTLSSLVAIFRGVHLSQSSQAEGDMPIIRVADLSNQNISSDDLRKVAPPSDKRQINYCRTGDILLSRIGSTLKALLVNENLNGIAVDQSIYIIRLKSEYHHLGQYIVEYFRSSIGQTLLSSYLIGAGMPNLRLDDLKNLEIPIPEKIVIELISSIQHVENELIDRIEKTRLLRTKLFGIYDNEKVKTQLDELSTDAYVLSTSLVQSDSLDFQIRNSYPFPLAFPYRVLHAYHSPSSKYPEQLRVAENLLAFLATVGLSIIATIEEIELESNPVLNSHSIKKYFGGGISPGDWQQIAQASGKILRDMSNFSLAKSFAELWFKGSSKRESDFAKATKEFVQLKNDYKHDRGPKTPLEFEKSSNTLQKLLDYCYDQLSFFVKYPIRLIQKIDIDWQTNESIFDTLVFVGDHQGLTQENINYPKPLPTGKLFITAKTDFWISLYPFVNVQYCSSCKFRETYFVDRWDSSKTILKSFERGHTHENDDDALLVADDLNYWLKTKIGA